jgi:hypothetical protein
VLWRARASLLDSSCAWKNLSGAIACPAAVAVGVVSVDAYISRFRFHIEKSAAVNILAYPLVSIFYTKPRNVNNFNDSS